MHAKTEKELGTKGGVGWWFCGIRKRDANQFWVLFHICVVDYIYT